MAKFDATPGRRVRIRKGGKDPRNFGIIFSVGDGLVAIEPYGKRGLEYRTVEQLYFLNEPSVSPVI